MAIDAALLLRGLQEYRVSLDTHLQSLSAEYNQLDSRWQTFSAVYEGDAARQFHAYWLRTKSNFESYMDATRGISKILDDRITALIQAERFDLNL